MGKVHESRRRRRSSDSSPDERRYRDKQSKDRFQVERRLEEPTRKRRNADKNRSKERSQSPSSKEGRLNRLERLVEQLLTRDSVSSDRNNGVVRFTVKSDCIPEFTPGNPNLTAAKWLDKIEQLATINGWDDRTMIYHMQNRLSGLARTWYNNLPSYDYNWSEWKTLVKKTFPDHHDFAATLKKLVACVKQSNQTMTQYYFTKMDLIQACKIAGKDAVSCLIDGLRDNTLQNGAQAGRYETPESLYTEY